MKASFSISDPVWKSLKEAAKGCADGNESLLVEVAISNLLREAPDEIKKLVARGRLDRMAVTRDGWYRAFWQVLCEEFGQQNILDNPYAPRNFGGYYVVLLFHRSSMIDEDSDPFHPYTGPQMVTPNSVAPYQWTFTRESSPAAAALQVADKVREFQRLQPITA